ncbi:TadE/TadG family type IV pilus assembly protein [Roseicyclus sp.]
MSARHGIRGFLRETRGGVAVEFGLLAAMLVPALVLAFDLGLMLRERVAVEHALRSGVFAAMDADASRDSVEQALRRALEVATRERVTLERVTLEALSVVESCFCPDAPAQVVDCSGSCAPDVVYGAYTISVSLSREALLLPPAVAERLGALDAVLRVEVPAWARQDG